MTELLSATSAKIGIWLINLPQSKDRLSKMEAQLQTLGFDYTLFEAIDGRADWSNLCLNIDIPRFEKNVGRTVMSGEIGCYMSHIGDWRSFLDSQYETALVLEDDVVFHKDFLVALHEAVKS